MGFKPISDALFRVLKNLKDLFSLFSFEKLETLVQKIMQNPVKPRG